MAKKIGRNEASSSRSRGESVVLDHGRLRSSCGYCKSKALTSIANGSSAYSLTVDDYQDLLDRGWRRSGSFLYKPEMEKTCCPSYTIRLKAEDFVPSKEQARVYKRMQRWVPFDTARPLLDEKPYVVLSDFPTLQNGVSTPSQIPEKAFEQHCTESSQNEQHEALSDSDEELDPDFEGSDTGFDENSSPEENSHVASADESTVGDVGNIKIDLNETHVKFKDLQQSVRPSQRDS